MSRYRYMDVYNINVYVNINVYMYKCMKLMESSGI